MGLITVFFKPGKNSPHPYRKAIIDDAELDFFMELGASTNVAEFAPAEPETAEIHVKAEDNGLFKEPVDEG